MKKSHIYLIMAAVTFLLAGIIEATYSQVDLTFPHSIFNAIVAFIWCKEHASENNIQTSSIYRLFVALIPFIAAPVYFFKFFGLKQGAIKSLQSVLFIIFVIGLYMVPFYANEYIV